MPEPRDRARSTRTYGWKTASQTSIGHAGPVVRDVDLDLVADPPHADGHGLLGRRVLGLVIEQMLEHLAEPRLVAAGDQRVRGGVQRTARVRSSSARVPTVLSMANTTSNGRDAAR